MGKEITKTGCLFYARCMFLQVPICTDFLFEEVVGQLGAPPRFGGTLNPCKEKDGQRLRSFGMGRATG